MVTIDIDAADLTATRELPVTGSVDELIVLDRASVPTRMRLGDDATVCFRAQIASVPVFGVDWTFSSGTELRTYPRDERNCIYVVAEGEGPAVLRAAAAGRRIEVDIAVEP